MNVDREKLGELEDELFRRLADGSLTPVRWREMLREVRVAAAGHTQLVAGFESAPVPREWFKSE